MKKFYDIYGGSYRRVLALVLLMVTGMLSWSTVFAADGEFRKSWITVYSTNDDINHTYFLNPSDPSGCEGDATGASNYDANHSWGNLGTTPGLYVKAIMGQGWSNSGRHEIKDESFVFYYRTYPVGGSAGNWSQYNMKFYKCEDEGYKTKTYAAESGGIEGCNIAIATSSTAPGKYQFEFALVMTRYWTGGQESRCLPNNSIWNGAQSGYNSTFIVPGFKNYRTTATTPDTKNGKSKSFDITFDHYGTDLKKADIGTKTSITGAGAGQFTVTNLTNGKVTVKFTAPNEGTSDVNATLTITDADSKQMSVALVGKVIASTIPTVMIADEPECFLGPRVKLHGFLKYGGCRQPINKYGFFYCKRADANTPCTVTTTSYKAEISSVIYDGETPFSGKAFDMSFTEGKDNSSNIVKLVANSVYDYKAFVYSDDSDDRGYKLSSETGTFTTLGTCSAPTGDVIYYTLDNTQETDRCELRFTTLKGIIDDMKSSDWHTAYLDASGVLQKDIVIDVVKSEYGDVVNNTSRDGDDNKLEDINKVNSLTEDPSPAIPSHRLTLRAKVSGSKNKPTFMGGLSLLGSRYITLENLIITRSSTKSSHDGSALELGYYKESSDEPNTCKAGILTGTDIKILNCDITATGFNCVHAVGCHTLTFENCNFIMTKAGTTANDKDWGASLKFMSCYGLKFFRNSIKGSHATSLWLQHTQNTLVMNNVFWNSNEYADNVAFIRPMMFRFNGDTNWDSTADATIKNTHKITNLGIYYNTFYLADRCTSTYDEESETCTSSSASDKIDFFRLGGPSDAYKAEGGTNNQHDNKGGYDVANIQFMYNNCYSYDVNIVSSVDMDRSFLNYTAADINSTFIHNNFWGKPDKAAAGSTKFAFGSDVWTEDIEDIVCKSTANNPDGLAIKGNSINHGSKLAVDISQLGVANTTLADRFYDDIRPAFSDTWTFGAYQQSSNQTIDEIHWVGDTDDKWDNRGNWRTADDKPVTCANSFSDNLKVVIPDAKGLENIPVIPAWGDHSGGANPRGSYPEEYVEAGLKAMGESSTTMYASKIELQDGAAIKGIENLYNNNDPMRYTSATKSFEVERSVWMPVGNVIRKVAETAEDDSGDGYRDIRSGDFYIEDHEPHVYMQMFKKDDATGEIVPGIPFTDLKTSVSSGMSFGIFIPDQYGPYKLPSKFYYEDGIDRSEDNIPYSFTGRFANDNGIPSYTVPADGDYLFANNSYTANLNLTAFVNANANLRAKYFDYVGQSYFASSSNIEKPTIVKPQNGFILYWNDTHVAASVTPSAAHYVAGSTKIDSKTKRAYNDTYVTLKLRNASAVNYSLARAEYGNENQIKAFTVNEKTPDLYFIGEEGKKYDVLGINESTVSIPLGVRITQSYNMAIQFELDDVEGLDRVILEDRKNNTTYNLTEGETPIFSKIAPGYCEGRFYLNIGYESDEPFPTDAVEEATSSSGSIDIYTTEGNLLTVSATSDVTIEKIILVDMSGRIYRLPVNSPNFSQCKLNVAAGVYTVQVIADKYSKNEKVIVK